MSDDLTEGMPEPSAGAPAGSDAPTVASPTVDTPADTHAAAPTRRVVSAPVWAILLGVILLLAGGAAGALALSGGSSGHTGPAATPMTTTSTSSLASDFPAGAAPGGPAAGTSGGGSASGSGGSTPAGKSTTKTPRPTVIPHLGQLDFGTCTSGEIFPADVSWITKHATQLTITKTGQFYTPGSHRAPMGFFQLGIKCVPDHVLVFTATGPGGTTRATVTLSYVIGQKPHVTNFSAPGSTDCQGGTTTSVQFTYGTVNATSVKLSVSGSPLSQTSGSVSFGFKCPPMYLGTETYQVTLTASSSLGNDTRTIPVSLHPTS